MKGLVCSIKHTSNIIDSLYYIASPSPKFGLHECQSTVVLKIGEEVEAEEFVEKVQPGKIESGGKGKYTNAASKTANKIMRKYKSIGISEVDAITNSMNAKLKAAAKFFLTKLLLGAPMLIRFHNDSDGASGALCLFKALKELSSIAPFNNRVAWRIHRGVSYSVENAFDDILFANNFTSLEKPLLVIIDFGTAPESNEGIKGAKDKFDIIWLDHHPIAEGFEGTGIEHYINPWQFGGDSNYTAGLLACVFASMLSEIKINTIANASLIGDYSTFIKDDEGSRKLSTILELLTSDSSIVDSRSLTPYDIENVINNKEKFEELFSYATMQLEEALDSALKSVKNYKSKLANIYTIDFKNIRNTESKYPLPGRFASKLLAKLEELSGRQCILILHFYSFISIRTSKEVQINLVEVVGEAKKAYTSIESAGGHRNAASIKLADEYAKKDVMNFLLTKLGCSVS
jgi:RecJ-like exonuclease